MSCIYCDSPLVSSASYPHWRFCPVCEPRWIKAENKTVREIVDMTLGPFDHSKGRPRWGRWR